MKSKVIFSSIIVCLSFAAMAMQHEDDQYIKDRTRIGTTDQEEQSVKWYGDLNNLDHNYFSKPKEKVSDISDLLESYDYAAVIKIGGVGDNEDGYYIIRFIDLSGNEQAIQLPKRMFDESDVNSIRLENRSKTRRAIREAENEFMKKQEQGKTQEEATGAETQARNKD